MDLIRASYELMRRERDRECRKNFGFGIDEIPPMDQWEMKVRTMAIDASRSTNYQKGRPTARQREKIEAYNQVARRYRALADAEFQIRRSEIQIEVETERAAGTYQEPGIDEAAPAGAIALWLLCFMTLILTIWHGGTIPLLIGFITITAATVGLPFAWKCRLEDPRLIDARRKRRNMHTFWKIAG